MENDDNKVLQQLTTENKAEIEKKLPQLKDNLELKNILYEIIESSINEHNVFNEKKHHSDDEIIDILNSLKLNINNAISNINDLSKNEHADTRLDFYYYQASEKEEVDKLYKMKTETRIEINTYKDVKHSYNLKDEPKDEDGVTKIKRAIYESGYKNILNKMGNGIDNYIQSMPEIKTGRPTAMRYFGLIISLIEAFEKLDSGKPICNIRSSKGTKFYEIIKIIIKKDPAREIANAIKNRDDIKYYYT